MSEENSNTKAPRFTHWAACVVFSAITLFSAIEIVKEPDDGDKAKKKFENLALGFAGVTFGIAVFAVLMQLCSVTSRILVGTKLEGFMALIITGFWTAAVAIISDTTRGIAFQADNDGKMSIKNGNVYYFSWAGFVSSVTLLVNYLKSAFGLDIAGEIKTRAARLNLWSGLLATSTVVLGCCANIYKTQDLKKGCTNSTDKPFCVRLVYGLAVGSFGTFVSLLIIILKLCLSRAPFLLETLLAYLLVPAYVVGVAFITSPKGPGSGLGNLYYFSWLSFLISFLLAANCTEERTAAKPMSEMETA